MHRKVHYFSLSAFISVCEFILSPLSTAICPSENLLCCDRYFLRFRSNGQQIDLSLNREAPEVHVSNVRVNASERRMTVSPAEREESLLKCKYEREGTPFTNTREKLHRIIICIQLWLITILYI